MPVPDGMNGIPWPIDMSQPNMVHVGMAIATTAIMTMSAMDTLRLLAPANIESLLGTDYGGVTANIMPRARVRWTPSLCSTGAPSGAGRR